MAQIRLIPSLIRLHLPVTTGNFMGEIDSSSAKSAQKNQ
jgi:hypothetical protein